MNRPPESAIAFFILTILAAAITVILFMAFGIKWSDFR